MRIENLARLNKNQIESISIKVLEHYSENYFRVVKRTPIVDIITHLNGHLSYDDSSYLGFAADNSRILGCYLPAKKTILIDPALKKDINKFNFVAAHELGHFVLHRKVIISDDDSDIIQDSDKQINDYGKRELKTDLDFMEWQANYFAGVLLLPKDIFYNALINTRKSLDLRWSGKVYVDNQRCNLDDFHNTLRLLGDFFQVSKTVVKIRLKELNLLTDNRREDYKSSAQLASELMKDMLQKVTTFKNKEDDEESPF